MHYLVLVTIKSIFGGSLSESVVVKQNKTSEPYGIQTTNKCIVAEDFCSVIIFMTKWTVVHGAVGSN